MISFNAYFPKTTKPAKAGCCHISKPSTMSWGKKQIICGNLDKTMPGKLKVKKKRGFPTKHWLKHVSKDWVKKSSKAG